jgi:hypothetical protein
MLSLIVTLERGWDNSIFPTSMKDGGVSGIEGGRVKVGGVSNQPKEAAWLVRSSISELKLSIEGSKKRKNKKKNDKGTKGSEILY